MSTAIFSARFIPLSSLPVTLNTFDVTASLFDGNGLFSAADVVVSDLVFLDCFGSISAPGTVAKYKVIQIHSAVGFNLNVRLQYVDTGTPIDPGEVTSSAGFICRPSYLQGLAYHAAPTIHTIPDYVIQYARNQESFTILDEKLGGGKAFSNQYTNTSGAPLAALTPVRHYLGSLFTINASTELEVKAVAGVTNSLIANNGSGVVTMAGLIENISTTILVNSMVYLSKTGTITDVTPDIGVGGFVATDFVVQIGKVIENASDSNNKDLLVDIKIVGQL